MSLAYQRILLKLSGEALAGDSQSPVDSKALQRIVSDIAAVAALGVSVIVVVGAGNFLRGESMTQKGLERVTADQMGMLCTVVNGLALRSALQAANQPVALFSTMAVAGMVSAYEREIAAEALQQGKVVICAGGLGQPYLSTDSTAALRAIELKADIILKASTVDGVYSADPKKDPAASRYETVDYDTAITKKLRVMDLTAICLCQDHQMPIRVFEMNKPNVLTNIVHGLPEGTLITQMRKPT